MNARTLGSVVAAVALAIAVAGPAQAAPAPIVVVNGGFETGNFTGWTGTGDQTFNGVQCGPSPTVFQGNCSAFFGPVGTTGGIQQVLNDFVVGDYYTVSFAFQPDGGAPSSFSASIDGQTLANLNPVGGSFLGPYQVFSVVHRAVATSETLGFSFRDDPGFLFLDAVAVQVPEPASMALLGLGLAGLGFVRRRAAK